MGDELDGTERERDKLHDDIKKLTRSIGKKGAKAANTGVEARKVHEQLAKEETDRKRAEEEARALSALLAKGNTTVDELKEALVQKTRELATQREGLRKKDKTIGELTTQLAKGGGSGGGLGGGGRTEAGSGTSPSLLPREILAAAKEEAEQVAADEDEPERIKDENRRLNKALVKKERDVKELKEQLNA